MVAKGKLTMNRRSILKKLLLYPGLISATSFLTSPPTRARDQNILQGKSFHKRISLSQWSFHRAILGSSMEDYATFTKLLHSKPERVLQGHLDSRDILNIANSLGIKKVDLVNVLFFGHAMDKPWLNEFIAKAKSFNTSFQVLMCDQAGNLGASSQLARKQSINAHIVWLETAVYLGCKQLRVNAIGDGSYLSQLRQCADSLSKLGAIAESMGIELLVENHGYASNNGAWLAMLIEETNHDNVKVFADFDNFFMGGWDLSPERRYDRIQGLLDLAPFTAGVSAKSHDFGALGDETTIDFRKCIAIFEENGFDGLYSAEYEGDRISELEGAISTVRLTSSILDSIDASK